MNRYQDLEEKTRKIGYEIYTAVRNEAPSFSDQKRWTGRVMGWVMRDESFKIQLFRFIDVLPSLKRDDLVVRLLKEYFAEESNVPLIIRQGLKRISEKRILPFIAGSLVRAGVGSLARQFIAGRNPEDSVKSLEALNSEGAVFSIDLLGEVVVSEREAGLYAGRYLHLLDFFYKGGKEQGFLVDEISGHRRSFDVSLKVSSFYSQLDPADWEGSIEHAIEGLRPLFSKAGELGASITFDMEHHYLKDLIIAIFKGIFEEFKGVPNTGIAMQAYLSNSRDDLMALIEWAKRINRRITIRLVKGAYWDYEIAVNRQKGWPVPVFLDKEETDRNYEELTKLALENARFIRPAIATHNLRSVSHAIAAAGSLNLPREAFEFQMLYGMAEPLRRALLEMKYRVRVYTPVGEFLPGMAYLIRRLLENTSNESFLRKSFVEKIPFEELIKSPEPHHRETSGRTDAFKNEPLLDFSLASVRKRMTDALENRRAEFGMRYALVVAGNKDIHKEREIVSVNPSRPEEVVGRVASADTGDADVAVSEARKIWEVWKNVPEKERADYLFKAAEVMRKERYELAALEVYEVGKTWKDADGDITEAIDYLEYYGREMIRIGQSLKPGDYPGEENEYFYEPRGTGVVISPWNFPFAIPAGMVSAALVAGNCVIFKPSGLSAVTGRMLVEVFRKVGLPGGVLQFLPGPGGEVGEHLVSHPGIDFIAFTGSKDIGVRIIELAGRTAQGQRNIKKVIAEMGGKNAVIIDETADLDEAVKGVMESALGYQGQKCSACSRVIVIGDVFEEFSSRFKEAVESLKIGPPEHPSVFMGPVIDKTAADKIKSYIEMGSRGGRAILLRKGEGEGFFVGPAVFTDMSQDSPVLREEIFGPVIAFLRAKNIDEALDIANDSVYALTGGLYSRSPGNIRKVKKKFHVGNLYINRKITGALVARQPFGGFGMSGVGSKTGGPDYLLQFMNARSISENTLRKGFAPKGR